MNEEVKARLRAHLRQQRALARRLEELHDRLALVIAMRRQSVEDIRDLL